MRVCITPPIDYMAEQPPDQPFTALGTLETRYYYYSFLLQRVVGLTPREHQKENLFNLAPLSYWRAAYRHPTKAGDVAWDVAVDSLMQSCAAEGLYNPANVIGRGIWIIEGKGVTHYGDKVLIDGKKYTPKEIPREISGKRVFEVGESLHLSEPDSKADFTQIESMLGELHFQTPHAAMLLAGAIVDSMAAGALHWRPHTWTTGKSGSGKSAVMKVILLILRNCAEHYVGETTEAGIRQDLKHDCRPIVFDEAEPKSPQAVVKINTINKVVLIHLAGDMKRLLLTGGRGFLGRNAIPVLEKNYQVFAVGSKDYNLLDPVQTEKMFSDIGPEIVVHLAAKSGGIAANKLFCADFLFQNALMNASSTVVLPVELRTQGDIVTRPIPFFESVFLGNIKALQSFSPTMKSSSLYLSIRSMISCSLCPR